MRKPKLATHLPKPKPLTKQDYDEAKEEAFRIREYLDKITKGMEE